MSSSSSSGSPIVKLITDSTFLWLPGGVVGGATAYAFRDFRNARGIATGFVAGVAAEIGLAFLTIQYIKKRVNDNPNSAQEDAFWLLNHPGIRFLANPTTSGPVFGPQF